jgi:acetyl-CoA carboxylase alpha subunit
MQNVQQAIELRLREINNIPADKLVSSRYDKFRRMSALSTGTES